MNDESPDERARRVLRGKVISPSEMIALAKQLTSQNDFGLARRLLQRLQANETAKGQLDSPGKLLLAQQLCLNTYKDPDLPIRDRLERALEILDLHAELRCSAAPETLGLAGAIYKRKWEVDGRKDDLEKSLAYYLKGAESSSVDSPDYDYGYTAINASFILDLLADLEDGPSTLPPGSGTDGRAPQPSAIRRNEARRLREGLRTTLPALMEQRSWLKKEWWFYSTIAEACFGLGLYDEATRWFAEGRRECSVSEWKLEATVRQLDRLSRQSAHGNPSNEAANSVLKDLLDGQDYAVRQSRIGRVGLALSGGGFRASLFHIGVLARLAELDVLRSVEVLSCVSGGSIIGARYYLEVRKLLQSKSDGKIDRRDYVEIVETISRDFLRGVQKNIRMRMLAGLRTTIRMIGNADYTGTERLAELYDEHLFQLPSDHPRDSPLLLNELRIFPEGNQAFNPKKHNWRRAAKVPNLVLNATTLNTGHNWQFTATYMGEPPGRIDTRIDGNERFRRMYYNDAPQKHRQMALGRAVAASAGVPGLFEPLVLNGLYPDRIVRLVDGGVHDNQGVAALLEQECDVMLVSDASGQMQTLTDPAQDRVGSILRSNGILQARLRVSEAQELEARRRAGLLRGLMFVHLKKDLDSDPVNWVGCSDPIEASDEARPAARRGVLTSYGIRKDVQEKLAAIRTDLDSFSEIEAYALMVSGYRMTEFEFLNSLKDLPFNQPAHRHNWDFFCVEGAMDKCDGRDAEHDRLMSVLTKGSQVLFKSFDPVRSLKLVAGLLSPVLGLGILLVLWRYIGFLQSLGLAVVCVAGLLVALKFVRTGVIRRFLLYGGAFPLAVWHLWRFERTYLEEGQVKR